MELRALHFLSLLGFLLLEPGYGNVVEWLKDQESSMKSLEERVSRLESLENDVAALEERLNSTVAAMDRLTEENKDLGIKLEATEGQITLLNRSCNTDSPGIAFSASLSADGEVYQGPSTNKILIYKRVFSNVGGGYNPNTGIFTAPVGGLYYFSFSTFGYNTHISGAILLKNGVRQISTFDYPSPDTEDHGSNSVILQLQVGDRVHMELWEDARVFDNMNGHTTFSGFLIFRV